MTVDTIIKAQTRTELRPGWRIVRFDAMAEIVNDRVDDPAEAGVEYYVGLEHLDPESLKVRRWGKPTDVEATKLRFKPGDIIFGRRRAYQRKLAVAEFEGICSAHAMVLRAREDVVLSQFLPFFMQSDVFFERALSISVGSLSPTINWKALAAQEFALPPRDDQRRMAEILWAVEEAIESHKNLIQRANEAYAAMVDGFFGSKSPDLPELLESKSFDSVRLESVCGIQVGFPFKSAEFSDRGDRLLRCSNVGIENFDWRPDITKYWPTSRRSEVQSYLLEEGDIVIAMDRTFITEGFKIARISSKDTPSLLVQLVGRFRPTPDLNQGYLWAFLHSRSLHEHLKSNQQGTDLPHISRFDIEAAILPLPGIEEQNSLAEMFNVAENAKNSAIAHTERLVIVKQKLLQDLLG